MRVQMFNRLHYLGFILILPLVSCAGPHPVDVALEMNTGQTIENRALRQTRESWSIERIFEEGLSDAISETTISGSYVFPEKIIAPDEVIQEIKDRIGSIDFTIQEFPINTELYDAAMDIRYRQAYQEAMPGNRPVAEGRTR